MTKYAISCGDVIPGCAARFEAESEDELMQQIAEHARTEHGISELTPDVERAVKAAISRH